MHFDPDPHTAFIGLMGSHAYGMAREGSDVDIRGCVVPVGDGTALDVVMPRERDLFP